MWSPRGCVWAKLPLLHAPLAWHQALSHQGLGHHDRSHPDIYSSLLTCLPPPGLILFSVDHREGRNDWFRSESWICNILLASLHLNSPGLPLFLEYSPDSLPPTKSPMPRSLQTALTCKRPALQPSLGAVRLPALWLSKSC